MESMPYGYGITPHRKIKAASHYGFEGYACWLGKCLLGNAYRSSELHARYPHTSTEAYLIACVSLNLLPRTVGRSPKIRLRAASVRSRLSAARTDRVEKTVKLATALRMGN